MPTRKRLFVVVPLAGLAALAGYAYWVNRAPAPGAVAPIAGQPPGAGPPAGAAAGPVAIEVAKVTRARLQQDVAAVGTLRSNESVVVRPEISGRIDAIDFREGAPVRKGQLIIRFDDSVPAAEVAQAKANLALAESNYNRTRQLEREKFVSATAIDQSLNGLRVAQANLQLAEAKLAKTRIVAPFNGIIGIRRVSVGDYIKEGQDLATLEDVSSLKVDFRLPEQVLPSLKPGQSVEIATDTLPGRRFQAVLDAIDPLVDQNGRAIVLRARLPNTEGQLRPGMFVRTRLILEERPDALVVPEEAIVPVGVDEFVFRVVDGKAQRVRVRAGLRRGGQVEIVEGLSPDDVVVTAGQIKLRDGVPVAAGTAPPSVAQPSPKPDAATPPAVTKTGG